MERRNFLKNVGMAALASILPIKIVQAVKEEKRHFQIPNNPTIQATGSWMKDTDFDGAYLYNENDVCIAVARNVCVEGHRNCTSVYPRTEEAIDWEVFRPGPLEYNIELKDFEGIPQWVEEKYNIVMMTDTIYNVPIKVFIKRRNMEIRCTGYVTEIECSTKKIEKVFMEVIGSIDVLFIDDLI